MVWIAFPIFIDIYHKVYFNVMINDKRISQIIQESINSLLTEAIPSKELSQYFAQHGGVDRQWQQDGLGDATDDQIAYIRPYNSRKEASNFIWSIRKDPRYSKLFPRIYTANDGTAVIAFFDRSKINTGVNWGGEHFKKTSERIWRDEHDPNAKRQENDTYYYGGAPRRIYGNVPANDFGLWTNADYKHRLNDLEAAKERFKDYYTPKTPNDDRSKFKKFFGIGGPKKPTKKEVEAGRQKGEDEYKAWRDREAKHMKDYLNNSPWRWHRRSVKDGPRQW